RHAEQRRQHDRIQHQHRAWHQVHAVVEEQAEQDRYQAEDTGLEDVEQVGDAGKAPDPAIQPYTPEYEPLRHQYQRGLGGPQGDAGRWRRHRVTELVQADPGQPDHAQVVRHDHRAWQSDADPFLPGRHSMPLLAIPRWPCRKRTHTIEPTTYQAKIIAPIIAISVVCASSMSAMATNVHPA